MVDRLPYGVILKTSSCPLQRRIVRWNWKKNADFFDRSQSLSPKNLSQYGNSQRKETFNNLLTAKRISLKIVCKLQRSLKQLFILSTTPSIGIRRTYRYFSVRDGYPSKNPFLQLFLAHFLDHMSTTCCF